MASVQLAHWPPQPLIFSVDEVTLSGRLRLTGRLLLPRPPFLSRLEVAFLSPPQLDFRLGGLAAAADLPGSTLQRFLLVG